MSGSQFEKPSWSRSPTRSSSCDGRLRSAAVRGPASPSCARLRRSWFRRLRKRPRTDGRGPLTLLLLAAAALFPLLAALRHLDDNSLTSWAWVLEGRDLVGLWVLHLAVVCAALLLSRRASRPVASPPGGARRVRRRRRAGRGARGGDRRLALLRPGQVSRFFGPVAFFRDWGGALPAWTDLPLPALLYGAVFRLCGEHRLPQQLFTAALFATTAFATARIGGLLWGGGGARGALLLLASPACWCRCRC